MRWFPACYWCIPLSAFLIRSVAGAGYCKFGWCLFFPGKVDEFPAINIVKLAKISIVHFYSLQIQCEEDSVSRSAIHESCRFLVTAERPIPYSVRDFPCRRGWVSLLATASVCLRMPVRQISMMLWWYIYYYNKKEVRNLFCLFILLMFFDHPQARR